MPDKQNQSFEREREREWTAIVSIRSGKVQYPPPTLFFLWEHEVVQGFLGCISLNSNLNSRIWVWNISFKCAFQRRPAIVWLAYLWCGILMKTRLGLSCVLRFLKVFFFSRYLLWFLSRTLKYWNGVTKLSEPSEENKAGVGAKFKSYFLPNIQRAGSHLLG